MDRELLGRGGLLMRRWIARLASFLAARRVAPESVALAGLIVSVAAGVALAAGGIAREPRVWALVPALGLVRLALHALETRLVDCRPPPTRREEHAHGKR